MCFVLNISSTYLFPNLPFHVSQCVSIFLVWLLPISPGALLSFACVHNVCVVAQAIKSATGKIRNALEMFQHLRKSYGRDSDWAGEVIKMSRFIWASDRESEKADAIKGAKIPEFFETLDGIRSQYEFMAVDSGIVAYRQNGCWCNACMQVRGRGEGCTAKSGDDPRLIVPGCPRPELPWREGDVTRKQACGVRAGVAEARAFGRKLVEDGIRVGQWLGVQARIQEKCDLSHFWICKAISAENFAEATQKTRGCILERADCRKTIIDTAFSSNDVAIAVQFFKRDVADSTGHTFIDEGKVGIINSTELLHVGFDMDERGAVEQLVRRRSRRANAVQQARA